MPVTGGLAYEGLNNAGQLKSNLILVLNDNEMSIAKNVGGMASYLMPGIKQVGIALAPLGETAHPAVLAQLVKPLCPPCQNLVHIALVPDIPDQFILWKCRRYGKLSGKNPHKHAL